MARQNFYETLGLEKGASAKDIKSAYYQLAKKWHPDVNEGNPDAEKRFQEIQQAYEVLKDDEKRAMYDQVGHEAFEQAAAGGGPGGGPGGFGGFNEDIFGDAFGGGMDEMFNRVFGGGARESRPHVQVQLDLNFREAVQGCSKVVNFQTSVRCQTCNGSGLPPGVQPQTCKQCKGRGRVMMQQAFFTFESTCPACDGSGQKVKDHCRSCRGAGVVKGNREVRVDIPAGVDNGTTLKVHGEGGEGPKGGRPGNLMLQIRVLPDKVFRREGADIYVDVPVPFTQAILGGSVQVPTLTGDVLLKIKPGTQPGHKQVMRGKGVKVLNSRHYGDQYVLINVAIPTNITERQRQLIEEFAGEETVEPYRAAAESSG
jgi:molecular chaperone DnaJ